MTMKILAKNNISVLPKPDSQKTIVYLPFARHAEVVDDEEVARLEACLSDSAVAPESLRLKRIVEKLADNAVRLYVTPRKVDAMRSLMVLPNNKCNFSCSYCYSAKGRTNEEISPEVLKAGLAYFLNPKRAEDERLSISVLGGGEPLLSWHVLRPALEYTFAESRRRSKPCPVSLVTNGSICTDEIIAFCFGNGISLSVSFDILPDVQNRQRGHWEKVTANVNRFAEAGLDVALNTVISNENVGRMTEMIEHLHAYNPLVKKVSFKTLISKDYFHDIASRRNYYEAFTKNFFEAKKMADSYGIWLTCSYMNTCIVLTDRYCHGKFVITSEGDISVCHTVGSKRDDLYDKFVFGHIDGQTGKVDIDEDKLDGILSHDVYHNPSCEVCAARWHCAGGCFADHFHLNKEEHDAYCESMRLFLAYYLTYKYKL